MSECLGAVRPTRSIMGLAAALVLIVNTLWFGSTKAEAAEAPDGAVSLASIERNYPKYLPALLGGVSYDYELADIGSIVTVELTFETEDGNEGTERSRVYPNGETHGTLRFYTGESGTAPGLNRLTKIVVSNQREEWNAPVVSAEYLASKPNLVTYRAAHGGVTEVELDPEDQIDWTQLDFIVDPTLIPTEWSGLNDEYVPPVTSPFVDIADGVHFYREVAWAYENGIATGWQTPGGREYRPVEPINRDAMAAFLYRWAGSPAYTPPAASPFSDVSPDQAYYKEISWLYENGVTTGWQTDQGTEYRPLEPINRDAMAAFLFRMAGSPKYYVPAWDSPFIDMDDDQMFYREVVWARDVGIANGWSVDAGIEYRPLQPINRDAMAAYLFRDDYLAL